MKHQNTQCSSALWRFYKKNVIRTRVFSVSTLYYINHSITGFLLRRETEGNDKPYYHHTWISFLPSSSLNVYRSVEEWHTVYAISTTQILFTNSKHIGEDDMPNLGSAYVRVMVQETWGQNTMNGPYFWSQTLDPNSYIGVFKVGGLFPLAKANKCH
jgi:hypothetical protein